MIDQEFELVGTAFADVHLDGEAGDVISRGRTLRRRRKAVPVLATAGILAASLSLAVVTQSSPSAHTLGYHGAVVNVNNAAFSVRTDAKTGIITVTARELFEPKQLQAVLAKAGVRTEIRISETTVDGQGSAPCTFTGVTMVVAQGVIDQAVLTGGGYVTTINPAAIPAGAVMSFQYFYLAGAPSSQGPRAMAYELISGMPTGCVAN